MGAEWQHFSFSISQLINFKESPVCAEPFYIMQNIYGRCINYMSKFTHVNGGFYIYNGTNKWKMKKVFYAEYFLQWCHSIFSIYTYRIFYVTYSPHLLYIKSCQSFQIQHNMTSGTSSMCINHETMCISDQLLQVWYWRVLSVLTSADIFV